MTQIIFSEYSDRFSDIQKGQDYEEVCGNLLNCFLTTLNWGSREQGGVADIMTYQKTFNKSNYYGQMAFSLAFFFLVNILGLNLITGVIVDIFCQMREYSALKEYDSENVCQICNLERWMFQKAGINFDEHLEFEHNVWQYVYLLTYLEVKEYKSLDGSEIYVYEKIKRNDLSWIPIRRSLSLELAETKMRDDAKLLSIFNTLKEMKQELEGRNQASIQIVRATFKNHNHQ
eukprot:TRINITY_DN9513_c0_g1_i13.p1 TRINITY_DN9513_c0_g1~~TRINITY_DN9513_c0_g1_i13.p1  ORF type:complete len:231 (+),score=11.52 TRINITY_DN9513_c0_g1_i13:489-1181(+)